MQESPYGSLTLAWRRHREHGRGAAHPTLSSCAAPVGRLRLLPVAGLAEQGVTLPSTLSGLRVQLRSRTDVALPGMTRWGGEPGHLGKEGVCEKDSLVGEGPSALIRVSETPNHPAPPCLQIPPGQLQSPLMASQSSWTWDPASWAEAHRPRGAAGKDTCPGHRQG